MFCLGLKSGLSFPQRIPRVQGGDQQGGDKILMNLCVHHNTFPDRDRPFHFLGRSWLVSELQVVDVQFMN